MSSYLWGFMVLSSNLDIRLLPEDILYIGQHFLYIVHFGGIHNFVYISILTILWLTCQGYSHLSHAHLTTHYGEIVMRKYKSK